MAQFHYSKAYSKYGASMGRGSTPNLEGKLRLQRVRLDSGGYDTGGAYWGTGEPLYAAEDSNGHRAYIRAANREAAKLQFPGCKFYR